jgi:hypothetical protein
LAARTARGDGGRIEAVLIGYTFSGIASVALVASNVALALVAVGQFLVYRRTEGRRIQPVAIAHRYGEPTPHGRFLVFLTNDGTGTAFNVRFGIVYRGVEYPNGADYRDGIGKGHRHRVAPGQRVPDTTDVSALMVEVPSALYTGNTEDLRNAVFFARYQDAVGRVWETRNPADPLADFVTRSVRQPRFREWLEQRRRRRALRDVA